ncbi:hypothetical protein [Salinarimonas ramus]|uniref:Uncharacterized protein n=1 Tax=Salinarimonas ramus TaxID=690164 RepID=A0A917Q630_9HYPH|nr:hypothetical protein [Salinarimonas ramus]GGK28417.1 hypothetical protein GCM10011322_13610 [Salinarimonas ramus]
MAITGGPFFAVEFDVNLSVAAFHGWRIACRNVLDHRRRESRWWRSFGLWIWLSADGRLRGFVACPEITEAEFLDGLARRWPVSLQLVPPGGLRDHVTAVVSPGRIAPVESSRYQHVRLAVWPRRARSCRATRQTAPLPT